MSQPSVMRFDLLKYKDMEFSATSGSEAEFDYIKGVKFWPTINGNGPVIECDGHEIDISIETIPQIKSRVPYREAGGLNAILVAGHIMIYYKSQPYEEIESVFANKGTLKTKQGVRLLKLPCSKRELIEQFGKPISVEKG